MLNQKMKDTDIISPSVMGVTDQLLIRLVDELAGSSEAEKTAFNESL